jgi:FG-GAP-like repeat/FG-GAP repeat
LDGLLKLHIASRLLLGLGVMFVMSASLHAQIPAAPDPASVDQHRLEVSEELSESLANDILELSVITKGRDIEKTRMYFPDELTAEPFPSQPTADKPEVKWIASHGWTAKTAPTPADSASGKIKSSEFLEQWAAFLDHFTEIEDARFKVKVASFDDSAEAVIGAEVPTAVPGATGHARIAFFVIGRNHANQREWARGVVEADVKYDPNKHWQFHTFKLTSFDSLVATVDIYSEVSEPAGVAVQLPAFGAKGNEAFTYHGASAADFNNDGFIDLFVCGLEHNYLYLNDGHGKFREVSHEVGLDVVPSCTGVVALDYDNDGDEDVFLSNVGPQMLLRNRLKEDGKFGFEDVSDKAGVGLETVGFSAAVADVNGDGLPDVYVTAYNYYGKVVPNSWFNATNGRANLLFVNQGNGTFKEEARQWGVDDRRWSYAAEFVDINGDGKLDLYLVNDFGEKGLYINRGDRFEDEAAQRGLLDPGNGMGVSFGDFNNDGLLDLQVTNMSSTAGNRILTRLFPKSSNKDNVLKKLAAGNTLLQNMGDGKFKDVTSDIGGLSAGWAWGGGFTDFDNDGWVDIYAPNGFISGKSMKDT